MTDSDKIIVSSISELEQYHLTEISVAIGVFDGVHAGHRKLLKKLTEMASVTSTEPVAVTFYPHPRQILFPDEAPELLMPPEEKYRRLFECGVKAVVTIPFDAVFAALPPENFIQNCLHAGNVHLRGICVGSEWRFGAGGRGDSALLTELAARDGFLFHAVPELQENGETVSSTAIRKAVTVGDIEKANRYLSTQYEIFGTVIRGEGLAGSKLEHPTANVEPCSRALPPIGVYAARIRLCSETDQLPAVMNIGYAPTFDSYGRPDMIRVEVHLLAGGRDLYGQNVAVEPVQFLRKEVKFADADALKAQIGQDIVTAKQILGITETTEKEAGKMADETGKYTVIELSEQLGVKRTTVNDWLTKYAVYIEYTVQGKRRIYSSGALAVLKKVAELRAKGLSSFEIDAELAKVCAVHPQPEAPAPASGPAAAEPAKPEEKPVNARPEVIRPDEKEITALAARHDAEELMRQFQAMMDKIDRLEAMTKALPASAPAPVSIPVPERNGTRTALLWALFCFIVILLAAGGWFVRMELAKMKAMAVRQDAEIVKQVKINEGLRQDVFVLDNTRKDFEANVQRLEDEIAQERKERDRQASEAAKQLSEAKASLEQQRKSELQLQQERFEKERIEMVRKFEKQVLEAEKKALELEKREAERKAAEAMKAAQAVQPSQPAKPEAKPAGK